MRPVRRMLLLGGVWAGVGLVAAWWSLAVMLWELYGIAFVAVALADMLWLRQLPSPRIERRLGQALPLGVWSRVRLVVENPGDKSLRFAVHDLHPQEFEVRGLPKELELPAHERALLDYRLRPPRCGELEFPGCDLRLASPLGLWSRRLTLALPMRVRVFPNFAEISRYTRLATSDRLSQLGVRLRQRRGPGSELHQLREHRIGDSLRQIDRKATSTRH